MHGLANLGNTCYFNSALQCLLHCDPVTKYIYTNQYEGDCEFTKIYAELVQNYFNTKEPCVINVKPLLDEFQKIFKRFTMFEPHDAQDALFCIIDILERSYPELKNGIYGSHKQITIWPNGKSTVEVPFSILTLSINDTVCKISELIKKSMEWNTLIDYEDEEGAVYNAAVTRNIFSKLPEVLFISFDKKSNIELEDRLIFNELVYNLKSCVIHKGAQHGGHYFSLARYEDKWVLQDDENIVEIKNLRTVDHYYILMYILESP